MLRPVLLTPEGPVPRLVPLLAPEKSSAEGQRMIRTADWTLVGASAGIRTKHARA